MNARQRAAQVAAQAQRSRAVADIKRGVNLDAIRVRVKGDCVWALLGGIVPVQRLGPLAGACAGIFDTRTARPLDLEDVISELVIPGFFGVRHVGTLFIAFADGTRFDRPIRTANGAAELRRIREQIARFNAMADVAESEPSFLPAQPQGGAARWAAARWDRRSGHGPDT